MVVVLPTKQAIIDENPIASCMSSEPSHVDPGPSGCGQAGVARQPATVRAIAAPLPRGRLVARIGPGHRLDARPAVRAVQPARLAPLGRARRACRRGDTRGYGVVRP